MIYVTSDLHFFHKNVIKYNGRPFDSVEDMNKALIRNWNNVVDKEDDVYILGDVTLKGVSFATKILQELKGNKFLVKGNHDVFVNQSSFDKTHFMWIKDYYELEYNGQYFILFHYPIESWNGASNKSIHLHGHQHNKRTYNFENREKGILKFDVGVDANNMAPVSLEYIMDFFQDVAEVNSGLLLYHSNDYDICSKNDKEY